MLFSAEIIKDLPESLRDGVVQWAKDMQELGVSIAPKRRSHLAKIIACSDFAATILKREWTWFESNAGCLEEAFGDEDCREFVEALSHDDPDFAGTQSALRRFRNVAMLRILWRDVHGLASLDETLEGLSSLADWMLYAAESTAKRRISKRFGVVRTSVGKESEFVILGMGKLGGRELNFSSDIDLIFCYSDDGESDGSKSLSAHEYFTRLARDVIALIDQPTADGFVFRVDTRLRPFGDSGPLAVSFAALESYLLQHGRDWERYAYIKASTVGVQPSADVLADLQRNIIQPFVYRRYLDFGVFESLREMHAMIAVEVRRRDLQSNVKLGPGGIREAEFVVQALQLVRGGSDPSLQSTQLQPVVPRLVSVRGLNANTATELLSGYRFLRRLENLIQAIRDQQTHDLPDNGPDRDRVCLGMGYADWQALLSDYEQHRDAISNAFSAVALRSAQNEPQAVERFDQLWGTSATTGAWQVAIADSGGGEAALLAVMISEFSALPAAQQLHTIAATRLQRLIPRLVEKVSTLAQPTIALQRTLHVIEKILRRSAYLALLNENQAALTRLVELCGRSQYIARQLASYPVLLDELLDPHSFDMGISKMQLRAELQQRLAQEKGADSEQKMRSIAQHQRAAMFGIAIADFNNDLPIMKVSDGLTWLAEAVLEETLRQAWNDLTQSHGIPQFVEHGETKNAGFGIVGYGKLGGLELSYGSDLDVVFLHDSRAEQQVTNGNKTIDNSVFFARLVRRLVHFLTTQTGSGALYEIDTRLRPDGKSGLLVSNTEAFERYQEENAWTWEHQALLRARAVAGSTAVMACFERIREETLTKRVNLATLRADVIAMRKRMRKQLDHSSSERFDLKHGQGGIGDIEFLVQFLVLREAREQVEVIRYSDNIRQLDALVESGCLKATVGRRLQDIYRSYRARSHHLVLDGKAVLIDQNEQVAERQEVIEQWNVWLS